MRTIKVTNTASNPINVLSCYLVGSSQFTILTPPPAVITTSADIIIGFTPNGVGGVKTARLYLNTNTDPATTSYLLTETEEDSGALDVTPTSLTLEADGDTKVLTVTCATPFAVSTAALFGAYAQFCSIAINSNSISITAPNNNSVNQRGFNLLVTSGEHVKTIPVTQKGAPSLEVSLTTQPEETCTDAVYNVTG